MRNRTMAKDNVENNEAMPEKDLIYTAQISLITKILIFL